MKKALRLFFAACLSLVMVATSSQAVDLGVETGRDQRLEREKSNSIRNSQEKRESTGKKTSQTTSTGTDRQDQELIKATSQAMQNSNLDLTLSLGDVFAPYLAMMEIAGNHPAGNHPKLKYKLFIKPRKPVDFGLSAELAPGVIDGIKSDLLAKAAASSSRVSSVGGNEKKLQQYKNTLALYSIIIGQAYLYLSADLAALGEARKDKQGNITVDTIGYDDFLVLAEGALTKALDKIKDKRLKKIYQAIVKDKTPCRFSGALTTIQCGSSVLELSNPPKLTALGMILCGNGRYGGFEATYKISSGWSYGQAIDQLQMTSKYHKMAAEVSNYADELIAKGQAREAVMIKKQAWSRAKSGKTGLSLGKLIPGF